MVTSSPYDLFPVIKILTLLPYLRHEILYGIHWTPYNLQLRSCIILLWPVPLSHDKNSTYNKFHWPTYGWGSTTRIVSLWIIKGVLLRIIRKKFQKFSRTKICGVVDIYAKSYKVSPTASRHYLENLTHPYWSQSVTLLKFYLDPISTVSYQS